MNVLDAMENQKAKIVFWSCNEDDEILTHTEMNEAIHHHLDNFSAEKLSDFPETIEIFGYKRMTVNRECFKNVVMESAYMHLSEEHDGEDGHDVNIQIKEACDHFIDVYLKNYTPWSCEKVSKNIVNVRQWIAVNEPEWIEEMSE